MGMLRHGRPGRKDLELLALTVGKDGIFTLQQQTTGWLFLLTIGSTESDPIPLCRCNWTAAGQRAFRQYFIESGEKCSALADG